MKRKLLLIFCLCLLVLSAAMVTVQAAGTPEDDALDRCDKYCEKYYDEIYPQMYYVCMDGCMYGAGFPPN